MKKNTVKLCLTVGISVFLLYLAIHYWKGVSTWLFSLLAATLPLLVGAFVAYLVNIPMKLFESVLFVKTKNKFLIAARRPLCLLFSILCIVSILVLVAYLVIPQIVSALTLLVSMIPGIITKVLAFMERNHYLSDQILSMLKGFDWKSWAADTLKNLSTGLLGTVTSVVSGVISGFFGFIFSLYVLLCKDRLKRQFLRLFRTYLPEKFRLKAYYVISVVNDSFHKFIVGQVVEALILGGLCAVGMLIFRFPYVAMISAFISFTALIPIAGAYVGAGVGALMILTKSPLQALLFLVFIVILQQLEGNFIYPKVVGSSMGLPSIWVLAAVTVGGGFAGVIGMFLGVPLTAAAYRILRHDILLREQKKASVLTAELAPSCPDHPTEAPQAD